jgi:dihydrofolate reductase
MANVIYTAIASLDGYVADQDGRFDWAEPDEEVHSFINDLERPVGTYLYGRRMYEVMAGWETDLSLAEESAVMRDFAEIWQAADKVVYSKTLERVSTARTRIERNFDPEAVRQLKETAGRDVLVGGPALAAEAFRAGLVDRMPPARLADRGRERQTVPSRQRPPAARAAGPTPFRQRRGLPPLPRSDVKARVAAAPVYSPPATAGRIVTSSPSSTVVSSPSRKRMSSPST